MAGDYEVDSLAVPESLDVLQDLLADVGRDHPDLDPADLMMFETAVVEVAGNVVEHGQPAGKVAWRFALQVRPDRLEAVLSDNGQEYPGGTWGTEMPDELAEDGRGMALATAMLDDLHYERIDDVNRWRMVRRRG